jgi:integrase
LKKRSAPPLAGNELQQHLKLRGKHSNLQITRIPPRCVAHGLRKAALRRLAEHGSTTKEIAAVSGHRSLSEIERYTAKADQAGLAHSAIGKLPDAENG